MEEEAPVGQRSEVARLREQITLEYQAARQALFALASGNAKHQFINARIERVGSYQQRLASLIGEEASMEIVCRVFEDGQSRQS